MDDGVTSQICETKNCNLKANLQCPTCIKLGIQDSYFCSQLPDGEYAMKSKISLENNESLVYVKLTKSADTAISEYLRNPNKFKNQPSILFSKNEGQISIPILHNTMSNENSEQLQFKFSITIDADVEKQKSLFECYHYKKQNNVFHHVGSLKRKLCIHANDDVYETTKNRMAAIEEQQRAKRTREIDWFYTAHGKKVKVDKKVSVMKPISMEVIKSPSNSSQNSANVTTRKIDNAQKQVESNKKMSDILLMRKPLKERMIHMLAVKSYAKRDLFNAINKVSIQHNDVNRLTNTLSSIATLSENMYELLKEKWNDVHEDWPFYTIEEREQVKKRKQHILSSNAVTTTPFSRDKSPLPKQKEISPLPKPKEKSPLPKLKEKSSLPKPEEKSPLPKPKEKSPLPKLKEKSPLPKPTEKSPLPKLKEKNPLPKITVSDVNKKCIQSNELKVIPTRHITNRKSFFHSPLQDSSSSFKSNNVSDSANLINELVTESSVEAINSKRRRISHFLTRDTSAGRSPVDNRENKCKLVLPHREKIAKSDINTASWLKDNEQKTETFDNNTPSVARILPTHIKNVCKNPVVKSEKIYSPPIRNMEDCVPDKHLLNKPSCSDHTKSYPLLYNNLNPSNSGSSSQYICSPFSTSPESLKSNYSDTSDPKNNVNDEHYDSKFINDLFAEEDSTYFSVLAKKPKRIKSNTNGLKPNMSSSNDSSNLHISQMENNCPITTDSIANEGRDMYNNQCLYVHPTKKEDIRICVPDSTQDMSIGENYIHDDILNDSILSHSSFNENDINISNYEMDYGLVTSIEQRRRYKEDFNTYYKEYQQLHEEMSSVQKSFMVLGELLKQYPADSSDHKKVAAQVIERYEFLKKNVRFKMMKRRFDYLHEKLALIKNRVQEYDDMILKSSN